MILRKEIALKLVKIFCPETLFSFQDKFERSRSIFNRRPAVVYTVAEYKKKKKNGEEEKGTYNLQRTK